MVRESDSEDEAELDAYSDFDALDGGEVEVSPEDEQALAAFMVSAAAACPVTLEVQGVTNHPVVRCVCASRGICG